MAQEVITTYFVSAAYYDDNGVRQFGHDPIYRAQAKQSGETFLDLDLLMLKTAVETADAALASGKKSLIGFSVHSTTLRSRALRATYLAALGRTPEGLRKYLTARVAEVEPGVPLITLSEWVGVLRNICARVTIELHPSEPNLQDLRATGASTIALFLPITDTVTPDQRKHYAALLGRWTQALHKQDLLLSVAHMIDPVLIEVGRRAGVDFMSSEVVWPMVDEPLGVVKFSASNIAAAFGQRRTA